MLKKFLSYITFWKKEERNSNFNLRMMHGINRISILMFLLAMVILIVRLLTS